MEDPRIIPPRVDFLDQRTGKISREWFLWLLRLVGKTNDSEVIAAFDAAIGQASIAQLKKDTFDATYLAELPSIQPQVGKRDLQDVRLSVPQPVSQVTKKDVQDATLFWMGPAQQVTKRDLQDALLPQPERRDAELLKLVEGLSVQLSQDRSLISNLQNRLQEIQLQAVMPRTFAMNVDSANFVGTEWTDLTDGGATTLHKHDHGGMDGLTDDDHTHYWNSARGAARVSLRI